MKLHVTRQEFKALLDLLARCAQTAFMNPANFDHRTFVAGVADVIGTTPRALVEKARYRGPVEVEVVNVVNERWA